MNAFEELEDKTVASDLYEKFSSRLCMCSCESCEIKSPHPVFNCINECEKKEEVNIAINI